jgi:hypothetical protein
LGWRSEMEASQGATHDRTMDATRAWPLTAAR